jgi:hypothetical protein
MRSAFPLDAAPISAAGRQPPRCRPHRRGRERRIGVLTGACCPPAFESLCKQALAHAPAPRPPDLPSDRARTRTRFIKTVHY